MNTKKIIAGLLFTITNLTNAQINLEKSYSSKHDLYALANNATFFSNGINYYTFDYTTKKMTIYDENHIQKKQINLVIGTDEVLKEFDLITDKLFNNDDQIEILYTIMNTKTYNYSMILTDENGTIIKAFPNKSSLNLIKNNTNTYKLVLIESRPFSQNNQDPNNYRIQNFDVYSIPGTLSLEQENQYQNSITKAFPNPSESFITIDNKSNNNQITHLEIFNLEGKKVFEKSIINNNEPITIDVNSFSKGIYIYKLNGESNKFIKN